EGVVVDEAFAATFFPEGAVLGARLRLAASANPSGQTAPPTPPLTVVGVVPALPHLGPPQSDQPEVYVPIGALPLPGSGTIIVRGTDLRSAVNTLREEVRALDADLPLHAIETVDSAVARARYPAKMVGTWLAIIAGIALLLSSVGVYALAAHAVTQRTQEIGVRMALGARASEVVWLFMRSAVAQLALGITLGLIGVLATTQLLRTYLGDVSPRDPVTLAIVAGVLAAVALAASLLPARRATRVDPIVALRYE
ncbi:MAG TPA: FtsX-like permease family protein, partial [Gemmatimonadaceae bacterium]|nr:FtsX-like permease family protein [Gemmatimonadaceae bacterium]